MLTLREYVVLWLTILKNANETNLQRIKLGVNIDNGLNDTDNSLIESITLHFSGQDKAEFELIQKSILEYVYLGKPDIPIPQFVSQLGCIFRDIG